VGGYGTAGAAVSGDVVASVKDRRVASVRALQSRAQRTAAGQCVLESRALVEQVLAAGSPLEVVLRAQSANAAEDDELAERLRAASVPVHWVRNGVLRQVAGMSRSVSWLAAAVLPPESGPQVPWGDCALVIDGVADPGNLGTLVRTARALGVDDVVLTDPETDLGSRRVMDASRGAVLGTRVRRYASPREAVAGMHGAGFQVVATSPRGTHLQDLPLLDDRPVALVVGGESAGICQEMAAAADVLVAIPMAGAVESLNVGVAAGILLYELCRRTACARGT
jgi:TrmH family RNA methyltransferase